MQHRREAGANRIAGFLNRTQDELAPLRVRVGEHREYQRRQYDQNHRQPAALHAHGA